jgi:hypothetical protein
MGQERTDPGVTGFLGLMAWEKSYEPAVGLLRNLRPVNVLRGQSGLAHGFLRVNPLRSHQIHRLAK